LVAIFFLDTFPTAWALDCAVCFIGNGLTCCGLTPGFEGSAFAARVAVLDAAKVGPFRAVERMRETALLLPALAIRNLPFFIAIVSPAVGGSETEHYGRMQVFATEFPANSIAVAKR
jgi:hypothetical protein